MDIKAACSTNIRCGVIAGPTAASTHSSVRAVLTEFLLLFEYKFSIDVEAQCKFVPANLFKIPGI